MPPSTATFDTAVTDTAGTFGRTVGHELRHQRRSLGWTRADLRQHLGGVVSIQTLTAYELGTRQISAFRLAQLCRTMDHDPAVVVTVAVAAAYPDAEIAPPPWVAFQALATTTVPQLEPLRRWATAQQFSAASRDPRRLVGVLLERPAMEAMARQCGVSVNELAHHLHRVTTAF